MKGTMPMDMLAAWHHVAIPVVFVIVCVLLIIVILLQKGRGGGLSGAFGGGGGYSAFGAKTGDVFTWVTVGLTFMFVLIACCAVWFWVPDEDTAGISGVQGTETPTDAPVGDLPVEDAPAGR